ncbi:MAG: hypothetical protein WC516_04625 [Patescibacteria group bacterium]|jgi:hypothetical protein
MKKSVRDKKLEKIKKIAKKVRNVFEKIEENEGWAGCRLGGYCGRAAIQLHLACKRVGINIKISEGIGHAYNEYDGYIIDITATQFGGYPKVHIRKYKRATKELPEFYQKVRTHLSTKTFASSFWIQQRDIDNDQKFISKHFPGIKTGGRRRIRCQN